MSSEKGMVQLSDWADEMGMSVSAARYHCQVGNIPGAVKSGRRWLVPAHAKWPGDKQFTEAGDPCVIGEYRSRFEPIIRDSLLCNRRYASSVCKVGTAYEGADFDCNVGMCMDWLDRNMISDVVDVPWRTDLGVFLATGDFVEACDEYDGRSSVSWGDDYNILDRGVFDHVRVFWSERFKQATVVTHSYSSEEKVREVLENLAERIECVATTDRDGSWYWPGNATLITVTGPVTFLSWVVTEKLGEDSPVGDFAKDVLHDEFFPRCYDYETVYGYLTHVGASSEAMDAFRIAYAEYSESPASCGRATDASMVEAVEKVIDGVLDRPFFIDGASFGRYITSVNIDEEHGSACVSSVASLGGGDNWWRHVVLTGFRRSR